mgnify:CR=1 FL=1
MLQGERRNRILEYLLAGRAITVKELCQLLEASEATIRRDLALLEEEGMLERTHGGAMPGSTAKVNREESFSQKESQLRVQKRAIARKAFALLSDHDSVILDAGTTTFELARLIGRSDLKITVITNSTILASELSCNPHLDLITLGGKVRLNTQASVGSMTINNLRQFSAGKAFVATNGISLDNGLTTPDLEEAAVKHTMLSVAGERYILADHTKFERAALCQIAPLSMVDAIITDQEIDRIVAESYEKREVRLILA